MSTKFAMEIINNPSNLHSLSVQDVREFITGLEAMTMTIVGESPALAVEIPVKHQFSKGVYAREIFIPKGSFIIGKIHKYENLNILSKGDISVMSIEGTVRLKAPYTVVSTPGVKRVAYAHEDSVWTTIHGTDETDVDKIEEIFIAKTYNDVPKLEAGAVKLLEE